MRVLWAKILTVALAASLTGCSRTDQSTESIAPLSVEQHQALTRQFVRILNRADAVRLTVSTVGPRTRTGIERAVQMLADSVDEADAIADDLTTRPLPGQQSPRMTEISDRMRAHMQQAKTEIAGVDAVLAAPDIDLDALRRIAAEIEDTVQMAAIEHDALFQLMPEPSEFVPFETIEPRFGLAFSHAPGIENTLETLRQGTSESDWKGRWEHEASVLEERLERIQDFASVVAPVTQEQWSFRLDSIREYDGLAAGHLKAVQAELQKPIPSASVFSFEAAAAGLALERAESEHWELMQENA